MFHRITNPLKTNSFFMFGPRGTGKSTLFKELFAGEKIIWIDLLDPITWDTYSTHPETLSQEIRSQKGKIEWVIIDEVQKVPKLLDVVHQQIESTDIKFALTGSSARKLKKGAANLLAGRAFINYLFPLTFLEMQDEFDLSDALQWGTLPKISHFQTPEERSAFLKAYALTYLKEEIWEEHIVRNLDPFRKFLEVAAQTNGQIVNYTNIANDVGADTKTVQSYFAILEDTLIGILLEPYHRSMRKRQRENPKFYLFDTGIKRALDRTLSQNILPNTYAFGAAFEHYIVIEMHRLNAYFQKDFKFSYLRTKDDAEIDLIIERPGLPVALIEIKSSEQVGKNDVRTLEHFIKDFGHAEAFCLSRDVHSKKIGHVEALPWQDGIRSIFCL